jgi:hypothetical protein
MNCSLGTCKWTGDSEDEGVRRGSARTSESQRPQHKHKIVGGGRQSATLGFGHKLNVTDIFPLYFEQSSDGLPCQQQTSLHVETVTVLQALFLSFQVENLIDHDQVSKQLNAANWHLLLKVRRCTITLLFSFSHVLKRENLDLNLEKTFRSWGSDSYKIMRSWKARLLTNKLEICYKRDGNTRSVSLLFLSMIRLRDTTIVMRAYSLKQYLLVESTNNIVRVCINNLCYTGLFSFSRDCWQ